MAILWEDCLEPGWILEFSLGKVSSLNAKLLRKIEVKPSFCIFLAECCKVTSPRPDHARYISKGLKCIMLRS